MDGERERGQRKVSNCCGLYFRESVGSAVTFLCSVPQTDNGGKAVAGTEAAAATAAADGELAGNEL